MDMGTFTTTFERNSFKKYGNGAKFGILQNSYLPQAQINLVTLRAIIFLIFTYSYICPL